MRRNLTLEPIAAGQLNCKKVMMKDNFAKNVEFCDWLESLQIVQCGNLKPTINYGYKLLLNLKDCFLILSSTEITTIFIH